MNILIVDNYDSFTYNLYQYIGEILSEKTNDFNVLVKRNNEIDISGVESCFDGCSPDKIIISPGPGSPDNPEYFGVCAEVIEKLGKNTPLLGVCLGMQGIAYVFGGKVIKANIPMHGKTSSIRHNEQGVYKGLPQELEIMRYHSLMVEAESLPECLEVTSIVSNSDNINLSLKNASLNGDEIMGIRHNLYPIEGVQFHPESFATEGAKRLLSNFLLNNTVIHHS